MTDPTSIYSYSNGDYEVVVPDGNGVTNKYDVSMGIAQATTAGLTINVGVRKNDSPFTFQAYSVPTTATQPVSVIKDEVNLTGTITTSNFSPYYIYEFTGSLSISGSVVLNITSGMIGFTSPT